MMTDRETDLRNDAAKGLDGSPGNGVSAWAVREINRPRTDLEDYRQASEERGVEIARLKDENEALRHALGLWLAWREGPEGPDILFSEGAKALKATRAVLEDNP